MAFTSLDRERYAPASEIAAAAQNYCSTYSWPVLILGEAVILTMTEIIGAVAVPLAMAGRVADNLNGRGCLGPVIDMPGEQVEWMFLVDPVGAVDHSHPLPPGVRRPQRVALPPSVLDGEVVSWVVRPSSRHRPPTVTRVLDAVRHVMV